MNWVFWLAGAYLAGSIPTSYLAGRAAGIDLREHGSKNLGATNVYRVLGWKYAVPVGLFDVLKGAVPVALAMRFVSDPTWIPVLVGCLAVVGHVFPVFLRFRGGKGVATAAGVVLALAPLPLGISAVLWIGLLVTTGFVSVASMAGAVAFPVAVRVLMPSAVLTFWIGVVLATFILYTHRSNIQRLIAGTESRFGRRAKPAGQS
ncbi:MAG: glycerol-3-phosphate 1-O-acyltransferase PlsY [Gemmatimonadota bacterium]|nr:glycerol-3-phosphate 1-O-acyltransferase PlsY [Gemmatimonadota bacterium]